MRALICIAILCQSIRQGDGSIPNPMGLLRHFTNKAGSTAARGAREILIVVMRTLSRQVCIFGLLSTLRVLFHASKSPSTSVGVMRRREVASWRRSRSASFSCRFRSSKARSGPKSRLAAAVDMDVLAIRVGFPLWSRTAVFRWRRRRRFIDRYFRRRKFPVVYL